MKLTHTNLFVFGELAVRIDAGETNVRVNAVEAPHAKRVVAAGLIAAGNGKTTITEAGRAMLATNVDARRGYGC